MTEPLDVLILMSDTGGGHRSVAEAIAEGLAREFPDRYAVTLFDVIARGALFPFNHIPEWYLPFVTFSETLWGLLFRATNNRLMTSCLIQVSTWVAGRALEKYLRERSPALVVSVHPLLNHFPRRALRRIGSRAPFVTIVTDLFDAHRLWFDRAADLCIVATDRAREIARQCGLADARVRVVGHPIRLSFLGDGRTRAEARAACGLDPARRTILLVGGGEGMGALYEIARALAQTRLPIQLVVIAGRNAALQRKLAATTWEIPVRVEGFVTNMPDWMRASDLIITKAGPGTISEALACGLPILLSGFLPGQESGNVTFVETSGVGALRRTPDEIARAVREWLTPGDDTLARWSTRARALARPRAALEIAAQLDALVRAGEVSPPPAGATLPADERLPLEFPDDRKF